MKSLIMKIGRVVKPNNPVRKYFRRKYIQLTSDKNGMNHEVAKELLAHCANILESLEIKYWLDAGTCLGAVREGGFISHDKDMDIGLYMNSEEEVLKIIQTLLDSKYVTRFFVRGDINTGFIITAYHDDTSLDFFFMHENRNNPEEVYLVVGATGPWPGEKMIKHHFKKRWFDNLTEIDFLGIKTYTPNPVDEFLTCRYGDWRTPVSGWDWRTDSKNAEIEGYR